MLPSLEDTNSWTRSSAPRTYPRTQIGYSAIAVVVLIIGLSVSMITFTSSLVSTTQCTTSGYGQCGYYYYNYCNVGDNCYTYKTGGAAPRVGGVFLILLMFGTFITILVGTIVTGKITSPRRGGTLCIIINKCCNPHDIVIVSLFWSWMLWCGAVILWGIFPVIILLSQTPNCTYQTTSSSDSYNYNPCNRYFYYQPYLLRAFSIPATFLAAAAVLLQIPARMNAEASVEFKQRLLADIVATVVVPGALMPAPIVAPPRPIMVGAPAPWQTYGAPQANGGLPAYVLPMGRQGEAGGEYLSAPLLA